MLTGLGLRKFIIITCVLWLIVLSFMSLSQVMKSRISLETVTRIINITVFHNHSVEHQNSFHLDTTCNWNQTGSSDEKRAQQFNTIYEKGLWARSESGSGPGSTIAGAFDWIIHLRSLFQRFNLRSMADIPCGDTYWQFSVKEINAITDLYFGGDISSYVVHRNQIHYRLHGNKIFKLWDLVRCQVPTFTRRNGTHEEKGIPFDLIVIRDAIQHMNILNGLKAVRNAVLSGAKFIAVSSYPPQKKPSSHSRTLGNNETLPSVPPLCEGVDFCKSGSIADGGYYQNNINCPPFNFPLDRSILVQPSHRQFAHENDEIHVYPIDNYLKDIVKEYDKACQNKTR